MKTIAELRELCEKATPGPWDIYHERGIWRVYSKPNGYGWLRGEKITYPSYGKVAYPNENGIETPRCGLVQTYDSEFITASRAALPLLLDEIESIRRALSFYATYTPRFHPEGYYEMHVAPGEGGEVRFGTFARKTLAESKERLP